MVAPLLDYMPGIRKGIIADLPRRRLAPRHHRAPRPTDCGRKTTARCWSCPRTWKAALAPWLAGIPRRTGFVGEGRFGLINDLRFRRGGVCPAWQTAVRCWRWPKVSLKMAQWPLPELRGAGRRMRRLARTAGGSRPTVGPLLRSHPGPSAPPSAGPAAFYADLARRLAVEGHWIWVIGGPNENEIATEIAAAGDIRDPHRARPAQRHSRAPPRRMSRYRTIPVCCTSPLRSAHRPSESSDRLAHGTGLRSNPIAAVVENDRRSAVPPFATSRSAGSTITAACAAFSVDRVALSVRQGDCPRADTHVAVSPAWTSRPRRGAMPPFSSAARTSGTLRLLVLAPDDGDRSVPDRSGEAGLAPRKDCDERHAKRRGEMNEPSIHADHEKTPPQ